MTHPDENTPIGTIVTVTRGGFLEDLDVVIVEHGVANDGVKYARVYEEYDDEYDDISYYSLKLTDGMDMAVVEKRATALAEKSTAIEAAVAALRAIGDNKNADFIERYLSLI